jgi:hypothetical protein
MAMWGDLHQGIAVAEDSFELSIDFEFDEDLHNF